MYGEDGELLEDGEIDDESSQPVTSSSADEQAPPARSLTKKQQKELDKNEKEEDIQKFIALKKAQLKNRIVSQAQQAVPTKVEVVVKEYTPPPSVGVDTKRAQDSPATRGVSPPRGRKRDPKYYDLDTNMGRVEDPTDTMMKNWAKGPKAKKQQYTHAVEPPPDDDVDPYEEYYGAASPIASGSVAARDVDYRVRRDSSDQPESLGSPRVNEFGDTDHRPRRRDRGEDTDDSDRRSDRKRRRRSPPTRSPSVSEESTEGEGIGRYARMAKVRGGFRRGRPFRRRSWSRDRTSSKGSHSPGRGGPAIRGGMHGPVKHVGPARGGGTVARPFGHLICKFYRDGYCREGPECGYSHDIEPVQKRVWSDKKPELCRYYLQGYCRLSNKCPFMHDEFPCFEFHTQNGYCSNGQKCMCSHAPLDEIGIQIMEKLKQRKLEGGPNSDPYARDTHKGQRKAPGLLGFQPRLGAPGGPGRGGGPRPQFDGPPQRGGRWGPAGPFPPGPGPNMPHQPAPPFPPDGPPAQPGFLPPPGHAPPNMPHFPPQNMPPPFSNMQDPAGMVAPAGTLPPPFSLPPPLQPQVSAVGPAFVQALNEQMAATSSAYTAPIPAVKTEPVEFDQPKQSDSPFDVNSVLRQIKSSRTEHALLDHPPETSTSDGHAVAPIVEESPASPEPQVNSPILDVKPSIIPSGARMPEWRLIEVLTQPPDTGVSQALLRASLTDTSLRNDPRLKKGLSSQFDAVSSSFIQAKESPPVFKREVQPIPHDVFPSSSALQTPSTSAAQDPRSANRDPRQAKPTPAHTFSPNPQPPPQPPPQQHSPPVGHFPPSMLSPPPHHRAGGFAPHPYAMPPQLSGPPPPPQPPQMLSPSGGNWPSQQRPPPPVVANPAIGLPADFLAAPDGEEASYSSNPTLLQRGGSNEQQQEEMRAFLDSETSNTDTYMPGMDRQTPPLASLVPRPPSEGAEFRESIMAELGANGNPLGIEDIRPFGESGGRGYTQLPNVRIKRKSSAQGGGGDSSEG